MPTKKTIKPKTKLTKKKTVRKKKDKGGRPVFNGRSEKAVILKLKRAFEQGCTIKEARVYASISKTSYYNLIERKPKLKDEFEDLKVKPVLLARTEVVKGIKDDKEFAFKFLQVRKKDEFAPHSTFTGDVKVEKLSDERKASIMERLKKWK